MRFQKDKPHDKSKTYFVHFLCQFVFVGTNILFSHAVPLILPTKHSAMEFVQEVLLDLCSDSDLRSPEEQDATSRPTYTMNVVLRLPLETPIAKLNGHHLVGAHDWISIILYRSNENKESNVSKINRGSMCLYP